VIVKHRSRKVVANASDALAQKCEKLDNDMMEAKALLRCPLGRSLTWSEMTEINLC
jgi:hypothetical protein